MTDASNADEERAKHFEAIVQQLLEAMKREGAHTAHPRFLPLLRARLNKLLEAWKNVSHVEFVKGVAHVGANPWRECGFCHTHFDSEEFSGSCPMCDYNIAERERRRDAQTWRDALIKWEPNERH